MLALYRFDTFLELDKLILIISPDYRYEQLSLLLVKTPHILNFSHNGYTLKSLSQAILIRDGQKDLVVLLELNKPVNRQFHSQCGIHRVALIVKVTAQTLGTDASVQTSQLIFLFHVLQVQYHFLEVFVIVLFCIEAKGYRTRELLNSMREGSGLHFFGIKLLFFFIFRFIIMSRRSCLFLRCCSVLD